MVGDRQRSDARRNHDKLLDVAVRVFAEEGPDAPLEHIARDAGVGIGTLYRHFPTREALVVETYRAEVEQLCAAASELLEVLPPDQALREWMNRFVGYVAAKRGMAPALRAAVSDGVLPVMRAALVTTLGRLLAAGQAAGTLRADYGADEVLRAMSGVWLAADPADQAHPDALLQAGRLLDLLMDGLRSLPGK